MRWSDLLKMSLGSLKRRKLRAFLTILGVVIGTTSIVVMISLGLGLQESMYEQVEQNGGTTTLTVYGKDNAFMSYSMDGEEEETDQYITDEALESFAALEHVESAFPRITISALALKGRYEGYLDTILETSGMNVIRFLVAAVPVVIAVAGRKIIKAEYNRLINICVNMSCFYIAVQFSALFVGANYIGRIATYFNVYNLILLPWMIKNCFTKDSEEFVKLACLICYFIYFYYQIVITWNLGYVSDILGLSF